MILQILSSILSPDFIGMISRIMREYQASKDRKRSVDVDSAINTAEKSKSTEDLKKEMGKLLE